MALISDGRASVSFRLAGETKPVELSHWRVLSGSYFEARLPPGTTPNYRRLDRQLALTSRGEVVTRVFATNVGDNVTAIDICLTQASVCALERKTASSAVFTATGNGPGKCWTTFRADTRDLRSPAWLRVSVSNSDRNGTAAVAGLQYG